MADPAEAPRSILDVSRFLHEPNCRTTGNPYGTDTWFAEWLTNGPQCCQPCQTHWLLDHLADVAADRARLQQQVQEMIDVAGEALATDPENRSIGCVEALAQWSHQLRDDLADLIHLQPVGAHRDCHDLSCNAHREYPRGAKGVCCSCSGRDAAYEALTQLRQALGQLPRYWVRIDRAFPEPMACIKAEAHPDGEWVKYEDLQKALMP